MFSYYVECHYAECHYTECHYAECHYAECHYAECHYAECLYAECLGAIWFSLNRNLKADFEKKERMKKILGQLVPIIGYLVTHLLPQNLVFENIGSFE
jgi:hypothetical protein